MNTMTDNDIIKALECCRDGDCKNCTFDECTTGLLDKGIALDLINSQKAEIERLVEHTKEGIYLAKQLPEMLELAQAEAIKEFAERLKWKATATHKTVAGHYRYEITNDFIDTLVKEMVGDNNGKE